MGRMNDPSAVPGNPPERMSIVAGETLSLELEAVPGGGYVWSPASVEPTATLEALPIRPDRRSVGGTAIQAFRFRAETPGVYALRFVLTRPWEAEVRREHRVEVAVLPADATKR
jgi:predicted secreted protein